LVHKAINHTIDFFIGVSLLNAPLDRTYKIQSIEIKWKIQDLLSKGFIKPSISPCASPILIALKKDGTCCLCID